MWGQVVATGAAQDSGAPLRCFGAGFHELEGLLVARKRLTATTMQDTLADPVNIAFACWYPLNSQPALWDIQSLTCLLCTTVDRYLRMLRIPSGSSFSMNAAASSLPVLASRACCLLEELPACFLRRALSAVYGWCFMGREEEQFRQFWPHQLAF